MFLVDFFRNLFQSRVTSAQATAKAKVIGAQARARGKAAGAFNKAIDGSIAKAKGKVKGGGQTRKEEAKKEKKMGFWIFGRKKKEQVVQDSLEPEGEDAKTRAINIAEFADTRFKPCVGWLVVMNGPQQGRDFRLVPGRNRIGTDADMEVVLTDPYVSAHHANIVYTEDGVFQLSDAGSTNGTKLNGKKVMQAQLVDNDTLQIGRTTLKFKSLN